MCVYTTGAKPGVLHSDLGFLLPFQISFGDFRDFTMQRWFIFGYGYDLLSS